MSLYSTPLNGKGVRVKVDLILGSFHAFRRTPVLGLHKHILTGKYTTQIVLPLIYNRPPTAMQVIGARLKVPLI